MQQSLKKYKRSILPQIFFLDLSAKRKKSNKTVGIFSLIFDNLSEDDSDLSIWAKVY